MRRSNKYKAFSRTFTTLRSYARSDIASPGWRDSLVTGNGENGVAISCSPYDDTQIYQHMYFLMPSPQPRYVPRELTAELHEARQAVINLDDSWNVHGRKRTFLYCFHPGHQLRLKMSPHDLLDYVRWTDYETGEICVRYSDLNGVWMRKTFSSRSDNVTVTEIVQSDTGTKIDLVISLDDLSGMPNSARARKSISVTKNVLTPSALSFPWWRITRAMRAANCGKAGTQALPKLLSLGVRGG